MSQLRAKAAETKLNGRDRLRRKQFSHNITLLFIALSDFSIIGTAITVGYYIRFYLDLELQSRFLRAVPIAPYLEYAKASILTGCLALMLFHLFQLYRRERSRWILDEFHIIIKGLTIAFFVMTSLTFFAGEEGFNYSRMVFLYSYLLAIVFLSAWHYFLIRIERWLHNRNFNISRIIVLGSGDMSRIVVRKLRETPGLGYRIIGFITAEKSRDVDLEGYPCLGEIEQFEQLILKHHIDEVFVSETNLSHFKLLEIVSMCENLGVLIKMVPNVYDLLIDFADMSDLDGLPLVTVREQPMYEVSLAIKRVFDIVFAISVLLATLPLSIIIAVAVKLDSPGGIVFRQRRAGVGGKPFYMYKFRTMFVDAETQLNSLINFEDLDEPVFKIRNDPRITRVGKLLRRTSLDEVLQFWNVLKGDMSAVGPRPEETQLVDKYNIWQRRRLKIKPGITGMQQIMCRGTTSLENRLKYDIYYLRKHSLLLDIWIIIRTIPVVLSGKGAF